MRVSRSGVADYRYHSPPLFGPSVRRLFDVPIDSRINNFVVVCFADPTAHIATPNLLSIFWRVPP